MADITGLVRHRVVPTAHTHDTSSGNVVTGRRAPDAGTLDVVDHHRQDRG
ncbi:hypothetical protein [Actinomyces polynesiensis]|nr:hypothetical protein [Actinomyces polynesiensis]